MFLLLLTLFVIREKAFEAEMISFALSIWTFPANFADGCSIRSKEPTPEYSYIHHFNLVFLSIETAFFYFFIYLFGGSCIHFFHLDPQQIHHHPKVWSSFFRTKRKSFVRRIMNTGVFRKVFELWSRVVSARLAEEFQVLITKLRI